MKAIISQPAVWSVKHENYRKLSMLYKTFIGAGLVYK